MSRRRIAPLLLAASIAAAATSLHGGARAQGDAEIAQAKKWFKEGEAAEKRNDCRAAIDSFRKALAVKETPQLLIRIGACQEKLGDLVGAKASYEGALERANAQALAEVADVAKDQIAALEPRVPTVTFVLRGRYKGLTVKLDGLPLAESSLGAALPLNPGDHNVAAEVPGHAGLERRFTLAEKDRSTIPIELPGAIEEAAAPPPATGTPFDARTPEAPPTEERSKVPAIALIAGGGAAVLAGVVLFVVSLSKDSDIDDLCGGPDRKSCPESRKDEITSDVDAVNTLRVVSFVAGGVGLAAAGVGVALLVTAPKRAPGTTGRGVTLAPAIGPTGVGLAARGRF